MLISRLARVHLIGRHQIGDSALFMRLYTTLFRGRLYSLSTDNVGTFVVAKLFASAHTMGQLEMLADEVYPHLPEIIGMRCRRAITGRGTLSRIGGLTFAAYWVMFAVA